METGFCLQCVHRDCYCCYCSVLIHGAPGTSNVTTDSTVTSANSIGLSYCSPGTVVHYNKEQHVRKTLGDHNQIFIDTSLAYYHSIA